MKLAILATAAILSAVTALPAQAVTSFDAFTAFDAANNPSGRFVFGSFAAGNFAAFPTGGTCLFNDTTCLTSGNYLGAYKSADGLYHDSGTANISATNLTLHPGQNGEDSAVLFTTTTAGSYKLTITAYQADDHAVMQTIDRIDGHTLTTLATLTTGNPTFSYSERVFLGTDQSIGFGVGNAGDYSFDATGFSFTATAVPEPATWALMLVGLGLTGATMRRRHPALTA